MVYIYSHGTWCIGFEQKTGILTRLWDTVFNTVLSLQEFSAL
jgi:hypothetical protein